MIAELMVGPYLSDPTVRNLETAAHALGCGRLEYFPAADRWQCGSIVFARLEEVILTLLAGKVGAIFSPTEKGLKRELALQIEGADPDEGAVEVLSEGDVEIPEAIQLATDRVVELRVGEPRRVGGLTFFRRVSWG